jgi:hypothetical protein
MCAENIRPRLKKRDDITAQHEDWGTEALLKRAQSADLRVILERYGRAPFGFGSHLDRNQVSTASGQR